MFRETKNSVESTHPSSSSSSSSSSYAFRVRPRCGGAGGRMLIQNRDNFRKSSLPARFLYYDNGGSWTDFPPAVTGKVRAAFAEGRVAAPITGFGSDLIFDFLRMAVVDLRSGEEQSVAWIDDRGQCFFPKEFVGPGRAADGPNIVVEVRVERDTLTKRKRGEEEEEEPEVNSTREEEDESPKRQRVALDDVAESSGWPKARRLGERERIYEFLKAKLLDGLKAVGLGAEVTTIHKCTRAGEKDRARGEVFRMQEEITRAQRGGSSNTNPAWLGASRKEMERVLTHGFGSLSRVSGGPDNYGIGVHLSPVSLPHLSAELAQADNRGEKHIMVCDVILGNMEKVEKGSRQCFPSSPNFDTGCDDPNLPKWYIVWPTHMNRYILPKFVVSFKLSNQAKGVITGALPTARREHYSFDVLIPKLQTSLSPAKSQEVVTLYDTYKVGRLHREAFVKQLRCVVGDQTLISVVREIRGF